MLFAPYLRLALLLLSYWGYYRLVCRLTRMERTFIPLFVLSTQGLMIFLAGLIDLIEPMAYVLCAGGVAALGLSFWLKSKQMVSYPAGLWLLAALMLYAAWLLRDKLFLYNDDFSHWALIVRVMLQNGAFPTAADKLISFTSYPPGTACLIYYVCRIVSGTALCEWGMMMAQAALVLSSLAPLMSLCKKPLWCALPVMLIAAWFAIGYDIKLYELMVDSVMPLMAVACVALIALHTPKDGFWEWALMPPLALLTLVKNSALIFVVFVWLAYIAWLRPRKVLPWLRSLVVLAPIAVLLIWRARVTQVIPNALRSLHAMSGAHFKRILADKTMLDVLDTIHLMKERTLREFFVFFLCGVPLLISLVLRLCKVKTDPLTRLLPWLNVLCYGIYQFSLLCMYILSMHVTETAHLAQYTRYEGSVVLLLLGQFIIFGFGALRAVREQRPKAAGAAAAVMLCAMIGAVCVGKPPVSALTPMDQSRTLRVRLETLLQDVPRGEELHYLQANVLPDRSADSHFCARYLLWNPNVRTANEVEGTYTLEWYEETWQDCDYLIIQDHYPAVDAFVDKYFPEQAGQAIIDLKP